MAQAVVDPGVSVETVRLATVPEPRTEALPRLGPYDTPTGAPCPRTIRADGGIEGDGACHACGMGLACPLLDPWADPSDWEQP